MLVNRLRVTLCIGTVPLLRLPVRCVGKQCSQLGALHHQIQTLSLGSILRRTFQPVTCTFLLDRESKQTCGRENNRKTDIRGSRNGRDNVAQHRRRQLRVVQRITTASLLTVYHLGNLIFNNQITCRKTIASRASSACRKLKASS